MTVLALFYCLFISFIWGVTPLVYRAWGTKYPSMKLVALRGLGFLCFAICAVVVGRAPLIVWHPKFFLSVAVTTVSMCFGDWLNLVAVSALGAGRTTALIAVYPLYTLIISVLFLGEALTVPAIVGAVGLVCGAVLLRPRKAAPSNADALVSKKVGFACTVVASVLMSLSMVCNKIVMNTGLVRSDTLIFGKAVAVCCVSWTIWLVIHHKKYPQTSVVRLPGLPFGFLMATGLLSLGLANTLVTEALNMAPASLVTPLCASGPLWASLGGLLIFKERMTAVQWVGVCLILGSAAAVSLSIA